jgi:hypothetical protein
MKDGLLRWVEHLEDVIGIGAGIEEIPDIEGLEVCVGRCQRKLG